MIFVLLFSLVNCKPATTETSKKETSENKAESKKEMNSYKIAVGTYTRKEGHVDGKADGVYLLEMDKESGRLSIQDTIKNLINPSYLTIDDNILYAVNEIADGTENGAGTITKIDLNDFSTSVLKTGGDAPCHVLKIKDRPYLVVSNYMGVVSLFRTEPSFELLDSYSPQGSFAGPPRQESSHPHMAMLAPDNKTILISDLGMDNLIHLHIEEEKLVEVAHTVIGEGSGPRHMVLHTNNNIYVLNELNHSIDVLNWEDSSQPLRLKQSQSTLPQGNKNVFPAAIHLHPSEKYLYASNRGVNNDAEQSISLFSIEDDGMLKYVESYNTGGMVPRDFTISPNGKFLLVANQNSGNIVTFRIDENSGKLTKEDNEFSIKTPVCLKFY